MSDESKKLLNLSRRNRIPPVLTVPWSFSHCRTNITDFSKCNMLAWLHPFPNYGQSLRDIDRIQAIIEVPFYSRFQQLGCLPFFLVFCRVYMPDHSYVTIRSRLSASVQDILTSVTEKLQYSDEQPTREEALILVAVASSGGICPSGRVIVVWVILPQSWNSKTSENKRSKTEKNSRL